MHGENITGLIDKCFPEIRKKKGDIAKYLEKMKLLIYTEKPLYQNLQDVLF